MQYLQPDDILFLSWDDLSPSLIHHKQSGRSNIGIRWTESPHTPVRLECGHVFGEICIRRWLKDANTCPNCRDQLYEVHFLPQGQGGFTVDSPQLESETVEVASDVAQDHISSVHPSGGLSDGSDSQTGSSVRPSSEYSFGSDNEIVGSDDELAGL